MKCAADGTCRASRGVGRFLIGKAIDRKANEAATFVDVLDGLSAGLFLIDTKGLLVHANAPPRAARR